MQGDRKRYALRLQGDCPARQRQVGLAEACCTTSSPEGTPLARLVRVGGMRRAIENYFEAGGCSGADARAWGARPDTRLRFLGQRYQPVGLKR